MKEGKEGRKGGKEGREAEIITLLPNSLPVFFLFWGGAWRGQSLNTLPRHHASNFLLPLFSLLYHIYSSFNMWPCIGLALHNSSVAHVFYFLWAECCLPFHVFPISLLYSCITFRYYMFI